MKFNNLKFFPFCFQLGSFFRFCARESLSVFCKTHGIRGLLWTAIFFLFCTQPAYSQVSFGQTEKINDEWKFIRKEIVDAQSPKLNDAQWQNVDLPHDWSIKEPLSPSLSSATGYLPGGIGWYRKNIYVSKEKQGKKIYLYFEGVYSRSEVFINGKSLGKRPSGYASFAFDATPWIEYGKNNLLAVRVDHSREADSRWYTGSGIYRNVWVVYANPIHIAQWGVHAYPKAVTKTDAILSVDVSVENGSKADGALTLTNELLSPDGKVVAKQTEKLSVLAGSNVQTNMELKVSNPRLWSLETPHLYQLRTTISKNDKVIDQTTTTTGIRIYTFDPDQGFTLNGKTLKMKGVCIHHDAGVLGAAVPKEVWKRRLIALKELGCNAIRCSHNPHNPELYELCDELGLLVMDEAFDEWEFPKRKWLKGWNKGKPGYEGIVDFFEEWGETDLADMVRRDRNHVSIFAWSIGNEIDYPNDPYSHPILNGSGKDGFTQPIFGGYRKNAPDATRLGAIAKKLVSVVKRYDKSRPVTAALAGVAMSNETEFPGALDIVGYNYTESFYAPDHKKYPRRIIYGSENGHSLGAWKAVTDNPHIFGQFLWTGIDHLGESGSWPARGSSSGLLDLGGFIKPRGYFRQSLWAENPVAYLGTYPAAQHLSTEASPVWNYDANQTIRVVCYTNATKARLELNGKQIGEIKDYDNRTRMIHWDIPYQAGKLEVIGLNKENKEIVRYAIRSAKQPAALAARLVDKLVAGKGVAQIVVQVVDEKGVPHPFANDEVTCQITGPGKLSGLEAGNLGDVSDYADDKQRVHHGRLIAYIQATGKSGEVRVKFSAPGLKSAEVVFRVTGR